MGSGTRRIAVRAGAVLLLVLAVLLPWLLRDGSSGRDTAGGDPARTTSPAPFVDDGGQSVLMSAPLAPRPQPASEAAAGPACSPPGRIAPFRPVTASATDATSGATVLAMPRDAAGVPGVPPLSSTGKNAFAWDDAVLPGSRHGNVLLNAHTWPDGSALGNRLLGGLDEGELVVLRGADGRQLCYRVTDRVEVSAAAPFPRYYEDIGRPQVALVVCSGQRLGPGSWTHRTVWFGRPVR